MASNAIITQLLLVFIVMYLKSAFSAQTARQQLVAMDQCNIPQSKLDLDYLITVHLQPAAENGIENGIIKGNITVPKRTTPLTFNMRTYKVANSKKKILFKLENLSCKNPLISHALKQVHFNIDANCCAPPAFYDVNHVDQSSFRKAEVVVLPPGAYWYEFEVRTKRGVILCIGCKLKVA